VRRDREAEARVHPRRVALDRRVDELVDAGEVDDGVELPRDLGARHAHDRALQVDVLAAGQIGVKAGGDLDEPADAALDVHAPADLREQLEDRRLAGAVGPMMASASPEPTSNETSRTAQNS